MGASTRFRSPTLEPGADAIAPSPPPSQSPSARSFADDRALLQSVLTEVIEAIEGPRAIELHERVIALGKRSREGEEGAAEELAELVADLPLHEMQVLVRSLTRWFQLVNLAEDNERVRRVRVREVEEAPAPRRGSLHDAMERLAEAGTTADELKQMLLGAELRPVLTAHPTESLRRTTVEKLARVFGVLRELDQRLPAPGAEEDARRRLSVTIQELWTSDEIRAVSPTVLDEVRSGLVHFRSTLAKAVPAFYRDFEDAVARTFPDDDVPVPPLLSFGSWIGGDRDGNPYVTPDVTAETLAAMREQCLRFLEERLGLLAGRLALSTRVTGPVEGLDDLLAANEKRFPDHAAGLAGLNPEEPFRRALSLMATRLRATRKHEPGGYAGASELLADLHTVAGCLADCHAHLVADGEFRDVVRQVEVFGFHFARLDIRENAKRHRAALEEVLSVLGVHEAYGSLPSAERVHLLAREIAERRPLIPADLSGFSDETREVVETFRTLHELLTGDHKGAIQSYVVSNTTGPEDLLEVLLLMKESRLSRAGGEDAMLRVVPLFEAGETLEGAADTMRALLELPVYRAAVAAVGDEQEIMVGYSDSNKDVGYVASGWATYRAQIALSDLMREHGVSWIFFHGRGGAVGRGGGPSNVAIAAQPPGTVAGRLKITEQGEVLSAKYSVLEVAHRELELVASAAVSGSLDALPRPSEDRLPLFEEVLDGMARRSSEAYRELVYGDDGFADFFHAVTPVKEISSLRLGSRPAKRQDSSDIEDFRAIPWVFSWTQSRIVLPAWFGLGTALEAAREEAGIECLREMERDWPFFAGLLSNAEMACAKADLAIGRRYAGLCEDDELRERVWGRIEEEFERTRRELLAITGGERLLDREPVLQRSIDRRNPYVDPLSFVQIELMRRARAGDSSDELQRTTFLAINGIAGGLRNTG
jgi:phosphoenolpyruvate carboxylase